ncbi:type II toxin-antitoxin system PemK/MazF family toxin (plasmid) [Neptuniibacter sp. QD72_48]|uniref:type II toxin-antitoxin system PemK/MazF family toxin n=1 Tax=Neptuniibacter sp. QD72_48 TaxID=3398214 RepID=UPI0039F5A6AF
MTYIPEQGDIIWLNFDPSAGKEIQKRRPAFVISQKLFNQTTGFAMVAPITSTQRGLRTEVDLSNAGLKTSGSIVVHQMRTFDFKARNATLIEHTPPNVQGLAMKIAQAIVS